MLNVVVIYHNKNVFGTTIWSVSFLTNPVRRNNIASFKLYTSYVVNISFTFRDKFSLSVSFKPKIRILVFFALSCRSTFCVNCFCGLPTELQHDCLKFFNLLISASTDEFLLSYWINLSDGFFVIVVTIASGITDDTFCELSPSFRDFPNSIYCLVFSGLVRTGTIYISYNSHHKNKLLRMIKTYLKI